MTQIPSTQDFPTVGMVGGGQLARMTVPAAIALGIDLRVLAADAGDSAARVIRDFRIGNHDDKAALLDFAQGCDVVTFDHEQVPADCLDALVEAGAVLRPGPTALIYAQDKIAMRRALTDAGLPCPRWTVLGNGGNGGDGGGAGGVRTALATFAGTSGWPLVLKVSRGGYDGRGVWMAHSLDQAVDIVAATALPADASWLVEEYVDFVHELAAQVARSPHGQAVAYPVVRTVQTDGICTEVIAPAPGLDPGRAADAQRIALQIAELLGVTGMIAVEMFDTGQRVVINELAMRPHNSGHWSIDGAVTSQFENHLRAVLDLPLGSPRLIAPYAVMVNILGGDRPDSYPAYRHVMARDPGLRIHMYGKSVRPGRKIGHVSVVGEDLDQLLERARTAADYLGGVAI